MTLQQNLDVIASYYGKPPICEVNWVFSDEPGRPDEGCNNEAKYSVWAHDNADDHTNCQILICQECLDKVIDAVCTDDNQMLIQRINIL